MKITLKKYYNNNKNNNKNYNHLKNNIYNKHIINYDNK